MIAWLRLHGHAVSEALRRFLTQPLAALAAVLVLAAALSLPLVATLVVRSAAGLMARLDTEPHVNVYLALDAADADVRRVGEALRSDPHAARVRFIPRAEALAELKSSTHLGELLDALDSNPLPDAFSVRLRSPDAQEVARVRSAWAALPKVDQVIADFEWSERLARWIRFGERALVVLGAFLAAAVVFIVGHLIRLQVLTRRDEIEVSRLIGATAADIRRPFLYHGLLQGLAAGAAALGIAAASATWLGSELQALTLGQAIDFTAVQVNLAEAALVAAGAAILGWVGAWLAVTTELRRLPR